MLITHNPTLLARYVQIKIQIKQRLIYSFFILFIYFRSILSFSGRRYLVYEYNDFYLGALAPNFLL